MSSLTFLRSIQSGGCECLKRRYCFWICEKSEVPWRVWRFEKKPRAAGLDLLPEPQKSVVSGARLLCGMFAGFKCEREGHASGFLQ